MLLASLRAAGAQTPLKIRLLLFRSLTLGTQHLAFLAILFFQTLQKKYDTFLLYWLSRSLIIPTILRCSNSDASYLAFIRDIKSDGIILNNFTIFNKLTVYLWLENNMLPA